MSTNNTSQNKRKLGVDNVLPPKKIKYDASAYAENVCGKSVDRREFRRAGPYILGPKIGHSPVESIVQYLAKKEGTDEFVQLKVDATLQARLRTFSPF